jgi:hypothetical protein
MHNCYYFIFFNAIGCVNMKKIIIPVLTAATIVGCASTSKMTQTFEPKNVEWVLEEGTRTITGQAFLKTLGGDVKTCAGNAVYLIPSSAYADERIQYIYGTGMNGYNPHMTFLGKRLPDADPRYGGYNIQGICDASGNFEFSNIPEGNYYLLAAVLWQTRANSLNYEGGWLMQRLDVKPESSRKYIMTY